MSNENRLPTTIPQCFAGQNIFITGGSGFIGKVLIEKLLRSCPDIGNIYLLMRSKKGQNPQERIKCIVDLPLFDQLKTEQSLEIFEKLIIVSGDVTELGLGLTDDDRALLIKNTNIIFHAAASVRFDDSLKKAILLNTRGTREVARLALQINNLLALMYVSTTYSQCHLKRVEEQTYPSLVDWQRTIDVAEHVDEYLLDIMTLKYIDPMPNTYTFSKNLAEACIKDLCDGKIPTIIFRPSIVISTAYEPVPGWIDNFNGPVGLLVASGKGVLRSMYTRADAIPDYIPVDLVVKAMILAVWDKIITNNNRRNNNNNNSNLTPVSVYNGSNNSIQTLSVGEMIDYGRSLCYKVPSKVILWYPGGGVTNCWYYHFLRVLFYQLLPAFVIDGLLKLSGHKFRLMKVHQKIYAANMALHHFTSNTWHFPNDNSLRLKEKLLPADMTAFSYRENEIDALTYFERACRGGKLYLLMEDDAQEAEARRHTSRMWLLSVVFNVLWYIAIIWLLFVKFDVQSVVWQKLSNFFPTL